MTIADEDSLQQALEFAAAKHAGQVRKGGKPYISHPVEVAEILKKEGWGREVQITALFHDLLEDTDATEQEIEEIGGSEVLIAVKLLTKEPGYVMKDYIKGIRQNRIAFAVKAADRLHNLQSAVETGEEFKRRYILETLDWYLDFSPKIVQAVKDLAKTLENPMTELSFLYEPIDSWKE